MMKTVKRGVTLFLAIALAFTLSSCGNLNESGQKPPIVYLTMDNELVYLKDPSADAVQLASFGPSEISYYYNDEDCVFYSGDGQTLYYFDLSRGLYDDSGAPLCCVDTASLDKGQPMPKLIDEYAIMNRVETSYVMEPLDGGGLIYMGVDYAEQCYALKYFDGESSSVLVEGREIYVAFNSDKTLANVCVYHNTDPVNDWSWYRMTIDGYPSVEYVCDGTLYPLNDMGSGRDFQTMAENDIIICESGHYDAYDDNNSYYTVDLYVHGQWREKLIEKLPFYSMGPFGIEVGLGVSFFVISTADLAPGNYSDDSQQWSFFRYERGWLSEVNEALRFQADMPARVLLLGSIHCINGEVVFRYDLEPSWPAAVAAAGDGEAIEGPEHVWQAPSLGWIAFDKTGEITEINDDLRIYWGSVSVPLTDEAGTSMLLYYGPGNGNCLIYACSDRKLKKLIDTPSNANLGLGLYERNGETCIVAYADQAVYMINASDMDLDTAEDVFPSLEAPGRVEEAIPCSNNDMLCVLSDGALLYWNGKKFEVICDGVRFAWSDCRRMAPNDPRIY